MEWALDARAHEGRWAACASGEIEFSSLRCTSYEYWIMEVRILAEVTVLSSAPIFAPPTHTLPRILYAPPLGPCRPPYPEVLCSAVPTVCIPWVWLGFEYVRCVNHHNLNLNKLNSKKNEHTATHPSFRNGVGGALCP